MSQLQLQPANIPKVLEECSANVTNTVISQCKCQRSPLNILRKGLDPEGIEKI